MKYSVAREFLDTGDIILFSGKGHISAVIKRLTLSRWSHVGTVMRPPNSDILLLMESTTLSDIPDVYTGASSGGVQVVPLSGRVQAYNGEIAFRHVDDKCRSKFCWEISNNFRKEVNGRAYEKDVLELAGATYDGPLGRNTEDLSTMFCSETSAEHWQRLEWLSEVLPSNEFDPRNFAGEGRDAVDDHLQIPVSAVGLVTELTWE